MPGYLQINFIITCLFTFFICTLFIYIIKYIIYNVYIIYILYMYMFFPLTPQSQ